MKTLILTIALVVLTTLAFSQSSNKSQQVQNESLSEVVTVEVVKNSHDHFTLVLKKETGQKVCIKIKEENGTLIHQKNLRKAESNTVEYDISALPEGNYKFEIKSGKNVLYSKTLKKSEGTIAMTD